MTVLHRSLATLTRLKWRAWWRRLGRRLRTPKGALFILLGTGLTVLWLWSIVWRARSVQSGVDPAAAEAVARATILVFSFVVIASAFGHRGLYLPMEELERLLSAPLSRAQLVRYRLISTGLRSSVFALIAGVVIAPHMPSPTFGFLGAVLAMMTLPMVGQGAAILMGDAEHRIGRLAAHVPSGVARVVAGVGLWALIMLLVMGPDLTGTADFHALDLEGATSAPSSLAVDLAQHPLVWAAGAPALPWARAMAAGEWSVFLPWFFLALGMSALLFEGVARLPIDFRELSLATSADVARRLTRIRSGRGAVSGAKVSDRAKGLRVPWLLGHGSFGAVAWLQLVALRRKAGGALLFALFTTGFALLLTTTALSEPVVGAVFLAMFGVMYLASGLRFDFRGNLDLMESMRAWPVAPWRVFLATIAPETLVVAALMTSAQVARAVILRTWEPGIGVVVLATPFVTLLWLALDNFVFLIAPVRFEPGQASAMHFAGRMMAVTLLKLLLLSLLGALVALAVWLAWSLAGSLELGRWAAVTGAVFAATSMTLAAIVGVVAAGGWALARFDVAAVKARMG